MSSQELPQSNEPGKLSRRSFIFSALATALGFTIERNLLFWWFHGPEAKKTNYTDDEIEKMVLSPDAVAGASAILNDQRISKYGIPVHIPAQSTNRKIIEVEYKLQGTTYKSQTSPEDIRLPTRPLRNWWPTDNPDLPDDHILVETAKSSQKGIDYINELYRSNGIEDALIPPFDPSLIKWQPEGGTVQTQASCNEQGLCSMNQQIELLGEHIFNSGATVYDIAGKKFIFTDYQSDSLRIRELDRIIHEQTHLGQEKFKYYVDYYERNDKQLIRALDDYTEALATMALAQYKGESESMDKLIDGYYHPGNPQLIWFNNIVDAFNQKGKNGLHEIISYGSIGDMSGLQVSLDELCGKGRFAELQNPRVEKNFDKEVN